MSTTNQPTEKTILKVLHTADWHLGQSFFGFDRHNEHRRFLAWLLEEIKSQQPDALLISGDVFDTANSSAVAQKQYFGFLARANKACPNMNIVIVAGNHDAGSRLEAPKGLLDYLHISVIGTVSRDELGEIDLDKFLVPLRDTNDKVQGIVVAVPFLRASDVPLVSGGSDSYLDGIREFYRAVTERACQVRDEHGPNVPLIAMGHCHLSGGDESRDSERRLVIGGSEALSCDVFSEELAYVALGHLHLPQHFRDGSIRYSGSPIPLSFSEINYPHQILRLTFDRSSLDTVDALFVPRSTQLLCVPAEGYAPVDEVLLQLSDLKVDSQLSPEEYPFLEIRVLEDQPDPTRRRKIDQALEGKNLRLASIKVDYPGRRISQEPDTSSKTFQDLRSFQPEDVFLDAYLDRYGTTPDEAIVTAFREVLLQESHK